MERTRIKGHTLVLHYQQDLVYSGNFYFGFDGNDLNVKTDLDFYEKQFESEDGSVSSTIEDLYVEHCRLYLDRPLKRGRGEHKAADRSGPGGAEQGRRNRMRENRLDVWAAAIGGVFPGRPE